MLLGEGTRRLLDYTPADYGVDVTKLVEQSTMLLEALQLTALQIPELQSSAEKVDNSGDLFNSVTESKLMLMLPQICGSEY